MRPQKFKCFMIMEFFDDTTMFMYGQLISSISSDTLDTNEFFMMTLTFFSMLSILDEACARRRYKQFVQKPESYPTSSFHPFWNGPQVEETFLKRYRCRRDDFRRMVIAMGINGQFLQCGRPGLEQIYPAEFCLLEKILQVVSFQYTVGQKKN
jgi:hypothetical protein